MRKEPRMPLGKALEKYEALTPPFVMFMAAREEIEEALAGGWSARRIWEALKKEGRMRGGYSTFARYVQEHVQERRDKTPPRKNGRAGEMDVSGGAGVAPRKAAASDFGQAPVPVVVSKADIDAIYGGLRALMESMEWVKSRLNHCTNH